MNKLFWTVIFLLNITISFAQPNSGFVGGVNSTYHSNSTYNDNKHTPGLGWQLGYSWNIKTYSNLSIRTELVFEMNKFSEQWSQFENTSTNGSYVQDSLLDTQEK